MIDQIDDLADVWQNWPAPAKDMANEIRALFLEAAPSGRPLVESLKWGEPAWRPKRGGTTLRLAWDPAFPDRLGCFAHCQTDLMQRLESLHPKALDYLPPRVAYVDVTRDLPQKALRDLADMAFTYKRVLPR